MENTFNKRRSNNKCTSGSKSNLKYLEAGLKLASVRAHTCPLSPEPLLGKGKDNEQYLLLLLSVMENL